MLIDKNYGLNIIGRTSDSRDTLRFLIASIDKLGLVVDETTRNPFKYLWSTTLKVPAIDLVVNGKGVNEVISLTSAYAELVERFSAFPESWHESQGGLNLLRQPRDRRDLFGRIYDHEYLKDCREGRYDKFSNIFDIELFLKNTQFSKNQIELIKKKSVYTRFWAPAKAVFDMDKVQYVPVQLVKLLSGTNGLAAGKLMIEAILHGTMEVLERYINTRMFNKPELLPTIDINSIEDGYVRETIQYFEDNDIEVVLKDVSFGLNIPAIAVLTFNKRLESNQRGYNMLKVGVATNTTHAIMRALTERVQGTTFAEERMLGEITDANRHLAYEALVNRSKAYFDLTFFKDGPVIPVKNWKYDSSDEVFGILNTIIKKLGSYLLVVDYTHKKLNFPVVQVIIPGVSDQTSVFVGKFKSLAFLGGVDEQLLKVEEHLEEVYKMFL